MMLRLINFCSFKPVTHTTNIENRWESKLSKAEKELLTINKGGLLELLDTILTQLGAVENPDAKDAEEAAHLLMGLRPLGSLPNYLYEELNGLLKNQAVNKLYAEVHNNKYNKDGYLYVNKDLAKVMDKLLHTHKYFITESREKTIAKLTFLRDQLKEPKPVAATSSYGFTWQQDTKNKQFSQIEGSDSEDDEPNDGGAKGLTETATEEDSKEKVGFRVEFLKLQEEKIRSSFSQAVFAAPVIEDNDAYELKVAASADNQEPNQASIKITPDVVTPQTIIDDFQTMEGRRVKLEELRLRVEGLDDVSVQIQEKLKSANTILANNFDGKQVEKLISLKKQISEIKFHLFTWFEQVCGYLSQAIGALRGEYPITYLFDNDKGKLDGYRRELVNLVAQLNDYFPAIKTLREKIEASEKKNNASLAKQIESIQNSSSPNVANRMQVQRERLEISTAQLQFLEDNRFIKAFASYNEVDQLIIGAEQEVAAIVTELNNYQKNGRNNSSIIKN